MAINYNEDGGYLGYFETLGTLIAQYNGRRGNFAIVGETLVVHNGDEWVEVTSDISALQAIVKSNSDRLNTIESGLEGLLAYGFEIRWGYTNEINPDDNEPELFSKSALEPDADNPVVYTTTRYLVSPTEFSKWSEPVVFSRYAAPVRDADQAQTIYYLSNYDDIALALNAELVKLAVKTEFQNDDFVPDKWVTSVPQPTVSQPYVYLSTRKQTNGVWGLYTKPVIAYTHIIGKDGVIDYSSTATYVAQYLQNDTDWNYVIGKIDDLGVVTSTLGATAEQISANVSSIVEGKFKSAGWEVTEDGVTLYGDKVKIKPSLNSSSYVAMFDSDGYLNVNLIKTINSNYYDANGALRASVNESQEGMFRTYYESMPNDSETAKLEPPKQLELGWDANTQSVLRLYNRKGQIIKALNLDGVIADPVFTDPYEGFEKLIYVDITPQNDWIQFYIAQTYEGGEAFFKNTENGKLYTDPYLDDAYLFTGVLTKPGTADLRRVHWYNNGLITQTKFYNFASQRVPGLDFDEVISPDINNSVIPTTDD